MRCRVSDTRKAPILSFVRFAVFLLQVGTSVLGGLGEEDGFFWMRRSCLRSVEVDSVDNCFLGAVAA